MNKNCCRNMKLLTGVLYVVLIAAVLIFSYIFLSSCNDNSDVTTVTQTSSDADQTSQAPEPEFVIDPERADEDADISVITSADCRTITIKVPDGVTTLDIGALVLSNDEWTMTDSKGELLEDGVVSITDEGDNSFTVFCGIEKKVYRIIVNHYKFYRVVFETLEDQPVTVREDQRLTAPDITPEKEGYTFSRWDFDFSNPVTSDITISCVWTPRKYKVTLDADGGTVTPSSIEVVYGEEFTLPVPQKDGFGFTGWFDGNTEIVSGIWQTPRDVTLKAAWGENIYTITYDPAGGTVPIIKQGVSYGQVYTLQIPKRTGYNFEGWYVDGQPVTGNVYNFTSDKTYVAQWSEMVCKVNYVTNGGAPMESEMKLFSKLTEAVPVREGYTFGGWYFNIDLSSTSPVIANDGSVTLYAHWTNERKAGDFGYEFTDGGVVITDFKIGTNICVIPQYIGGERVIAIGNAAFESISQLVEVVIPQFVTAIGERAFAGCTSLERINLENIESFGAGAFSGCGFSSFTVPPLVTEIPDELFAGCAKLTSVDFAGALAFGDRVFAGCTALERIVLPEAMTSVGKETFAGCSSLEEVVFGSGVNSIGSGAFYGCTSLSSIILPTSITSIEDSTFEGCTSLSYIGNLRDSSAITRIGERAFAGCRSLSLITVPSAVTEIGKEAFSGCSLLESLTVPYGVRKIAEGLFSGCTSLSSVTFLGNIQTVGARAFENCTQISSVALGSELVSIGDEAFANCVRLFSVELPATLEELGAGVFKGCTRLDNIAISSKVTEIPDSAFEGCAALAGITLHDGILHIGDRAFYGCSALDLSVMPQGLITVGDEAFLGCTAILSLEFYNKLAYIGSRAFADCAALARVTFYGSQEQWNGASCEDSFEGCISLGNVSVLTNIVDDLVPYIKPNSQTSELFTIDSSLSFNGRTPAVVIGFVVHNPFWRNFVTIDPENPDITSGAAINDKYVWKIDISGQVLIINNFSVINSGSGAYIILDAATAGFIPLAGRNRYTAKLQITDESGKILYTADLGETVFNNVAQSLTEDPSRSETDPYEDIELIEPLPTEAENSVSNLFDGDIFTKYTSEENRDIIIRTEQPVRLASYSFTSAVFAGCYPDAIPSGWVLYGGVEGEDGEIIWTEISVVEASGITTDSCREYNYKVSGAEEYSLYKFSFSGTGMYMLSGLDLYAA